MKSPLPIQGYAIGPAESDSVIGAQPVSSSLTTEASPRVVSEDRQRLIADRDWSSRAKLENVPSNQSIAPGNDPESGSSVMRLITARQGAAPNSHFRLLQQWEGQVQEIDDEEFTAILHDMTNPERPRECVTLDRFEVSRNDRELLEPGAIFYWSIGYRTLPHGQIERVSFLRFRRVPKLTRSQKARIEKETQALGEFFGFFDGEHPSGG